MSSSRRETKLVGPWRAVHAVIWLVGLAALAWSGRWWPGILLLIALSIITEALLKRLAPQAFQEVDEPPELRPEQPATPPTQHPLPPGPIGPESLGRDGWLPTTCPRCGGTTRANDVRWTGPFSADCPFCGSNLPLKRP